MTRCVVNVATNDYYRRGQNRLFSSVPIGAFKMGWACIPAHSPEHEQIPYAFKAFALKEAAEAGYDLLLWCDSCILPVRDMAPLWERIECDGYWFSQNGFNNYEWTADSAYSDLFPEIWKTGQNDPMAAWQDMRAKNRTIPHVVATAFGLSMKHEPGRQFLAEYFRLASETRAFCGPWINANADEWKSRSAHDARCAPCGPSDVRGHRHDQTAASVIAWRLGMKLTRPPNIFAYGKAGDVHDERTILLADGSY